MAVDLRDGTKWRAAYNEVCRKFREGEIDEPLFVTELVDLGFTTNAAQREVPLHHPPSPGRPI